MEETGGLFLLRECHRLLVKVDRVLGLKNQFSAVIVKSESGSHHQSAESPTGKFG